MKKRALIQCGIVLVAMTSVTVPVSGQTQYPERPITLIVPYAAGGGTDVVARLVGKRMGDLLGGTIVVENRVGAGGTVGTSYAARARPDGYTILLGTASTHAINPAVHKNLSYNPVTDFEPVSLLVKVPQVIVVNAASPYKSLGDLVDAMRANPGRITYGSQGIGGIAHLMGEMLDRQANVQTTHVPYKGAAPALQGLIAGDIDVLYDTLPALLPQIEAGSIRALAVAADERLAQLPDVPTTGEAGLPDLKAATWNALFAPKGTPQEAIEALSAAAVKAVDDPEIRARLNAMSAQPMGTTPAALRDFVDAEGKKWAEIVRLAGVRLD